MRIRRGDFLELGAAHRYSESRAARFQEAARAQAAQPDGVVTDTLDEFRHDPYRGRSSPATPSAPRSGEPGPAFEFVLADVVEGLDDGQPGQLVLNDLAARAGELADAAGRLG